MSVLWLLTATGDSLVGSIPHYTVIIKLTLCDIYTCMDHDEQKDQLNNGIRDFLVVTEVVDILW